MLTWFNFVPVQLKCLNRSTRIPPLPRKSPSFHRSCLSCRVVSLLKNNFLVCIMVSWRATLVKFNVLRTITPPESSTQKDREKLAKSNMTNEHLSFSGICLNITITNIVSRMVLLTLPVSLFVVLFNFSAGFEVKLPRTAGAHLSLRVLFSSNYEKVGSKNTGILNLKPT